MSESAMDAAVVGGGPAGAVCALLLARTGARVSLVHWPGYAPTGAELVSGHGCRLIEHLCPGFFRPGGIGTEGVEIREAISLWNTAEPVVLSAMFSSQGPGMAVDRIQFDYALLCLARAAGVSVTGEKMVGLERRGGFSILVTRPNDSTDGAAISRIAARYVVLATGRTGVRLFVDQPSIMTESPRIALTASVRPQPDADPLPRETHALYVEAAGNGWWYALPMKGGGYFIGFCTTPGELKQRQAPLKDFFAQQLRATRLLAPLLSGMAAMPQPAGRVIGRTASRTGKAAGDGWIMIGDAAHAPELSGPGIGMGMEFAIESARLGASAVLGALSGISQRDAFRQYEMSIHQRAAQDGPTGAAD